MSTSTQRITAIFADRASQQWVVKDAEGNFWRLPSTSHPWENREAYEATEDCELEPIPKHYGYMLNLPC